LLKQDITIDVMSDEQMSPCNKQGIDEHAEVRGERIIPCRKQGTESAVASG
jgi:hypothetical protein